MTLLTTTHIGRDSDGDSPSSVEEDDERITGLYYLNEVSKFLRATDLSTRGSELPLSVQQIAAWCRRGFFNLEKNEFERNKRFVQFPHLITSRMIAILLSYGISIKRIQDAHDYLQKETCARYPFATKVIWTEDVEASSHIYTEINRMLVTADEFGQMPFGELLNKKIVKVANMQYDHTERAVKWQPAKGVLIDPQIYSGVPCIQGTRIPTETIYQMHISGDSIDALTKWYPLDIDQIDSAIEWEKRLAGGARV